MSPPAPGGCGSSSGPNARPARLRAPAAGLCGLAPPRGCDENQRPNLLDWWKRCRVLSLEIASPQVLPAHLPLGSAPPGGMHLGKLHPRLMASREVFEPTGQL